MATMSTIVVFHDTAAPAARQRLTLCPDHLAMLRDGVPWAGVDEVVENSSVLPCEACAFLSQQTASEPKRGGNHEP